MRSIGSVVSPDPSKLLAAIKDAQSKAAGPKAEPLPDDELPELEELDSVPEIVTTDITEVTDLSSNAVHYKECVLTVPFRRDLLDVSVVELSRLAFSVIEAEGPVHTHEVARRIREAFGLQKTGRRVLAHVRSALEHLSRTTAVVSDGAFWSVASQPPQPIRNRRSAALPLRRATMIAPAEYRMALSTIIAETVTISSDDLLVETARRFGFDRTGPDLKEAIERQAATLVKLGQLHFDKNVRQFSARSSDTQ